MNNDITELMRLMRRELWLKRRMFVGVYVASAALFLLVAWSWPKLYGSSSTILVDQQSILGPLMQGTAVTTGVVDRAEVAREIIFSSRAMDEVLRNLGWANGELTDRQRERLIADIDRRTEVENEGANIIRISYMDREPERAFQTTKQLTDVFINHSLIGKQAESREAYEFINGQVVEYHNKLREAEQALKQFRSTNVDARPGSQEEVNARIVDLKRRKEAAELGLKELETQQKSLEEQLNGIAATDAGSSSVGQLRERLLDLQQELATLRLSYHDTYPDIVRVKGQIASVEKALAQQRRSSSGNTVLAGGASGELFQQLSTRYSNTQTELASLKQRLGELNRLLDEEEQRLVRISEVEAELAELTRDYQINQEIYNSLLRQRENARISMNIDRENQGLSFQIQEPAAMPLTPQGVRFSHFLAAGLVVSLALPFAFIYGMTLLDQKVRSRNVITDSVGLPVLASVYHINKPTEYTGRNFKTSVILLVVLVSWLVYGLAAWLKVTGEL